MIVSKWMSTIIVPIDENDSVQNAFLKLWKNNINILPVMNADKLTGIMTGHGLRKLFSPDGL